MWPIDIDEPHLFDFMNDHFLTLLIVLILRTEYMIKDISIIPTHMPTIIRETEVGILNQRRWIPIIKYRETVDLKYLWICFYVVM